MFKQLKVNRSILLIGVLFLFALVLTACGGSDSDNTDGGTDTPSEEESEFAGQTLRVQMTGSYSMEDATDPITGETITGTASLKEEFEALYPGVTVELILMPWDGAAERTRAMLTSGEADVYDTPGLASLARQDFFEPLESFIESDEDFVPEERFLENQMEGWQVYGPNTEDGLQTYALPYIGGARFILYDKQLFDDWGIDYLSDYPTMEEVTEKAEQMTGTNPVTGEENYGIWFRGDWQSEQILVNAVEDQNAAWGEGFSWEEIEFNFNSPEMVTGLNWMLDMQELAPTGILSNQGNEQWLTENNNIGIILNQPTGDFIPQAYAQGIEDRIGVAQMFKNEEGYGGLFAGSPLMIAKDSENKELAWEWLKFATSDTVQRYNFENMGETPTIQGVEDWESYQEQELLWEPALEGITTTETPRYPWSGAQPGFILTSEIEAALSGVRTVEEALNRAQDESTDWAASQ